MNTTTASQTMTSHMMLADFTLDNHRVRAAAADAHAAHRLIMSGFDLHEFEQQPRANHNILFAIDRSRTDRLRVLVRADQPPAYEPDLLGGQPATWTETSTRFTTGSRHHFEIRIAPMTRASHRARAIRREPDIHQWFTTKAARHGFGIDRLTLDLPLELRAPSKDRPIRERDRRTDRFGYFTIRARGTLTITDPAAFAATYRQGFGRGRSYGVGLLLTRPAA